MHLLRNALDYVPRKVDDNCPLKQRWMHDRRCVAEVSRSRQHMKSTNMLERLGLTDLCGAKPNVEICLRLVGG
ncbi:hypothetical protein [Bradyrhizobium sp. WSM471]|uniref:hypothetical protein n=1 Tax=Bradyrhizobium sp. WSM471 TaxID=319017 RepID=UPI0002FE4D48